MWFTIPLPLFFSFFWTFHAMDGCIGRHNLFGTVSPARVLGRLLGMYLSLGGKRLGRCCRVISWVGLLTGREMYESRIGDSES